MSQLPGHGPKRPTPVIGDATSAAARKKQPDGWAMGDEVVDALAQAIAGRRDIRRFRSDPVPDDLLTQVLAAGHSAPSVGHSQPWRFIVVRSQHTRNAAAALADSARVKQARDLVEDRAARLLDLKLEGLREAPLGIVVACDRRTPAAGVLGRATFTDTDLWSCACAIQNMWLTARSLGLGMGWVTLFQPDDLAQLLHLPEGVETLGWLCLGWPDERPPEPGLQRAAWSSKLPLQDVVLEERWPAGDDGPVAPASHLRAPESQRLVAASDDADRLLTPPEALGVLDRTLNRAIGIAGPQLSGGTLVLAGADHGVNVHRVSAYPTSVTADVMHAAVAGESLGTAHGRAAGLAYRVVDAGVNQPIPGALDVRPRDPGGDLAQSAALSDADVARLLEAGEALGQQLASQGLVALGEVGVGNTTVAAAMTCALLQRDIEDVVGLGSGSDSAMVERKRRVIAAALERLRTGAAGAASATDVRHVLAQVGGAEIVVLTGVCVGTARGGAPIVLDGLATCVAALAACRVEPSVQGYLIAGQRSREVAHHLVLDELGLEPLLSLRIRSGEGVGACLGAGLILRGLEARRTSVRTV